MQPSIPWSISVSVFVIERMAIIPSLKCTVPFSFVVPLLSLALTHYHLLSLVVTRRIIRCHSLSLVVIRCHSLSLDVPLVCPFINDHPCTAQKLRNNRLTFKQLQQFDVWSFSSLIKRKFKLNGKIIENSVLIKRVKRYY